MATYAYNLVSPPENPRHRELWLQHAAGFILMENIRADTIRQLEPIADETAKQTAIAALDGAMDNLMRLIDGVTPGLVNDEYRVELRMLAQLLRREGDDYVVLEQRDLRDGDGMCMGVHGWREEDYGTDPIVTRRDGSDE